MEDTLLGADERQDLRLGIEIHVVPTFVESCHCLAHLGYSHRYLVAVCIGQFSHLT